MDKIDIADGAIQARHINLYDLFNTPEFRWEVLAILKDAEVTK